MVNDESLEERASMLLSPLNVAVWGSVLLLVFVLIGASIIAFTPLKAYLPGFEDLGTREQATASALRVDSLAEVQRQYAQYIHNLELILNDELGDSSATLANRPIQLPGKQAFEPGRADSMLRKEVESEDAFNLTKVKNTPISSRQLIFFPPVKGTITSGFDGVKKHFGVDIATATDASVGAALEGKVVLVTWSADFGHVICVHHDRNYLTIYKHNARILKRVGDRVTAGEPIAIVGNSGEHTTGPHLHFEIWQEGLPLDPLKLISF